MDTFVRAKKALKNDLYVHDDDCEKGFMIVRTEQSSHSGQRTARYHCVNCSVGEDALYDADSTRPTIHTAGTTVTDEQQYTVRSPLPEFPSLEADATLVVTAIADAHPAARHEHTVEVYSKPESTDATVTDAIPLPDFLGHIKSHHISLIRAD